MNLPRYVALLRSAQENLTEGFRRVAAAHPEEADVARTCEQLAGQSASHAERLGMVVERYGEEPDRGPDRLYSQLFDDRREGGVGLLRDLQDLYLLASECDIAWTLIGQAAQGARDEQLLEIVSECEGETATQISWLKGRMKQAAPQALVVE